MKKTQQELIRRYVAIAVFSALAYAVTFVFRIPVSFLTFDAKDAVITVAAMFFGPLSAMFMSLIPALLELVTVSNTGLYGLLMNFLGSFAFAGTASLLYRNRRTGTAAILSVVSGALTMTAAMMLFNLFITPLYMGVERAIVISMIPTLLLPFNLAKGAVNAALTVFLYKPVSLALRKSGLVPTSSASSEQNETGYRAKRTAVLTVAGAVLLALGIVGLILLKK